METVELIAPSCPWPGPGIAQIVDLISSHLLQVSSERGECHLDDVVTSVRCSLVGGDRIQESRVVEALHHLGHVILGREVRVLSIGDLEALDLGVLATARKFPAPFSARDVARAHRRGQMKMAGFHGCLSRLVAGGYLTYSAVRGSGNRLRGELSVVALPLGSPVAVAPSPRVLRWAPGTRRSVRGAVRQLDAAALALERLEDALVVAREFQELVGAAELLEPVWARMREFETFHDALVFASAAQLPRQPAVVPVGGL